VGELIQFKSYARLKKMRMIKPESKGIKCPLSDIVIMISHAIYGTPGGIPPNVKLAADLLKEAGKEFSKTLDPADLITLSKGVSDEISLRYPGRL